MDGKSESPTKGFLGVHAYFLPRGIGHVELSVFKKRISELGGTIEASPTKSTTHVVVGPCSQSTELLIPGVPSSAAVVTKQWAIDSLRLGSSLPVFSYRAGLNADGIIVFL